MIIKYRDFLPNIKETSFIAPSSIIIGDVEIGEYSSVWFGTILRGDSGKILIRNNSNIQDYSILHEGVIVEDNVTVGHRVILHSCRIKNGSLIGAGAVVWDDCEVGENAIVGVGTVVPKGMVIPPKTLALGVPAKVVRELNTQEIDLNQLVSHYYKELAQEYKRMLK